MHCTAHVPLPTQTLSEPADLPTLGLQVLCLNTQVSLQSKVRALHAVIKQSGYPAALMPQEISEIIFPPLYASYYKSPNRNSIGASILVRRTQQIVILEVHFEPNYRAVAVRATLSSEKVQPINVYLKCGGEPRELRVTLEWIAPYLLDIYGGNFQANPRWDTSCPLASTAISTAIRTPLLTPP